MAIGYVSNWDEQRRNNLQKDQRGLDLDGYPTGWTLKDGVSDKSPSMGLLAVGGRVLGSASMICNGCFECAADCECGMDNND